MKIRPMRKADYAAVAELANLCRPNRITPSIEWFLVDHHALVMMIDGDAVGYSVWGMTADWHAYGRDHGIHPDYRRKGLGGLLHEARLKAARDAGASHFVGITWDANEPMKRILGLKGVRMTHVPHHFADEGDGWTYVCELKD